MGCRFGGRGVCLNMHSPYVLLPPYRPVNEDGSAFLRSVLTDSAPIFLSESCYPHSLKQPFKLPVVWLIPVSSLKLNIFFSPQSISIFLCLAHLSRLVSSSLIQSYESENPHRYTSAAPYLCCRTGWALVCAPIGRLTAELWLSSETPGSDYTVIVLEPLGGSLPRQISVLCEIFLVRQWL